MNQDERDDILRVALADDELMARKRLGRLLAALPQVAIVGEFTDGAEVVAAISGGLAADILLLDIQMPNLTGIEALGLIGEHGPVVVFTTAHADQAVAAFDGGAADYLLKPVDPARLVKALDRARDRLSARTLVRGQAAVATGAKVPLPTRKGIVLVDPADIAHAVIDGESVVLETRKGRFYADFRLSDLERRLPPSFVRVHRQAIANLDRVDRLEDVDSGGYIAVFDDGTRVAVSRQVARQLRKGWDLA